jgi:hypothetical protein
VSKRASVEHMLAVHYTCRVDLAPLAPHSDEQTLLFQSTRRKKRIQLTAHSL